MATIQEAFADLKAKVANQVTVDNSIEALVTGLKNQLEQLASQDEINPADVQALADTLANEQANIQAAVVAGTIAQTPGAAVQTEAAKTVQKPNTNIPVEEIQDFDPNTPEQTPTTVPDPVETDEGEPAPVPNS